MHYAEGTDANQGRSPPYGDRDVQTQGPSPKAHPSERERAEFFRSFAPIVERRALMDGLAPWEAEAVVSYVYEAGSPWARWRSLAAGLRIAYPRGVKKWRETELQGRDSEIATGTVEVRDGHPLCDVERSAGAHAATPLDDAMERLSVADREVLVMYYQHELSYAEIALTLGIGVTAARQRVCRAIQRMRCLLGVQGVRGDGPTVH